jgi:hypothetical protein
VALKRDNKRVNGFGNRPLAESGRSRCRRLRRMLCGAGIDWVYNSGLKFAVFNISTVAVSCAVYLFCYTKAVAE